MPGARARRGMRGAGGWRREEPTPLTPRLCPSPHHCAQETPSAYLPPIHSVSLLLPAGPLGMLSALAGRTVYSPPQSSGWALLPSLTQAAVAKVAVRQ